MPTLRRGALVRRGAGLFALMLACAFLLSPLGFYYCTGEPKALLFILGIVFGITAVILLAGDAP